MTMAAEEAPPSSNDVPQLTGDSAAPSAGDKDTTHEESTTGGSATNAPSASMPVANPESSTQEKNNEKPDSTDVEMKDVEQPDEQATPVAPESKESAPTEMKNSNIAVEKSESEKPSEAIGPQQEAAVETAEPEKMDSTPEKKDTQSGGKDTASEGKAVATTEKDAAPKQSEAEPERKDGTSEDKDSSPKVSGSEVEKESPAQETINASAHDEANPEPAAPKGTENAPANPAAPSSATPAVEEPEQMEGVTTAAQEKEIADPAKESQTHEKPQIVKSAPSPKEDAIQAPVKQPSTEDKEQITAAKLSTQGSSSGENDAKTTGAVNKESKSVEGDDKNGQAEALGKEENVEREVDAGNSEQAQAAKTENEVSPSKHAEGVSVSKDAVDPTITASGDNVPKNTDSTVEKGKKEDVVGTALDPMDKPTTASVEPSPMEIEGANEDLDDEDEQPARKRPRRSSTRTPSQPRTTRTRTSGRSTSATRIAPRSSVEKEESPDALFIAKKDDQSTDAAQTSNVNDQQIDLPRPKMTPDGLQMVVGESLFVTFDQLTAIKQKRMRDKKLKPIEELTFGDVHSYNRDQLRCYCFIYSTPRKKKIEMEADMARFVSLWNEGRPGYVLAEYVPNNPRGAIALNPGISDGNASRDTPDGASASGSELPSRPTRRSSAQRSSERFGSKDAATDKKQIESDEKGIDGAASKSASRTPSRAASKAAARVAGKSASKTPSSGQTPVSAKRPPTRPNPAGNAQPIPIQPNLAGIDNMAMGRETAHGGTSGSAGLSSAQHGQATAQLQSGSVSSTPSRANGAGAGKPTKQTIPIQPMPKGFGTSFKQKVHARTAGAKFKAAYNGAGPAIVNIVENAAAYFEGKDSAEVIADQAKSYERYQFNVDLLSEIFDGPSDKTENASQTNGEESAKDDVTKTSVFQDVAKRMRTRNSTDLAAELRSVEESFRKLENETKIAERANMRMFQRLDRAETEAEIEAVKRDFEREHNVRFEDGPPPLVRRKLDKSLPPLVMSEENCRILRFKLS